MQRVLNSLEFQQIFKTTEQIYTELSKHKYVATNQSNQYFGSFDSLTELLGQPNLTQLIIYEQSMLFIPIDESTLNSVVSFREFENEMSKYPYPQNAIQEIYEWLKNGWFVIIDENEILYYKTPEQCLGYTSQNETFDVWTPLHIKKKSIRLDQDVYLDSESEITELEKMRAKVQEMVLYSNKLTNSSKLNVLRSFNLF